MAGEIILDLCGGSGSWSRPYQAAGYDVRIITLDYIWKVREAAGEELKVQPDESCER